MKSNQVSTGKDDDEDEPKRRRLDYLGEKIEMPMVGPKSKHIFYDSTNPKDRASSDGGDSWDLGRAVDMKRVMKSIIEREPTAIICDIKAGSQRIMNMHTAKGCRSAVVEQARHGRYFVMAVQKGSKVEESQPVRSIQILPGAAEIEIRSSKWSGDIHTNSIQVKKALDHAKKKETSRPDNTSKDKMIAPSNPEQGYYPGWVCRAIKDGIRRQTVKDKSEMRMIASLIVEGTNLESSQVEKWERYRSRQGDDLGRRHLRIREGANPFRNSHLPLPSNCSGVV